MMLMSIATEHLDFTLIDYRSNVVVMAVVVEVDYDNTMI